MSGQLQTWSYLAYAPEDYNPSPCAAGLVSSSQDATPEWQFLALLDETLASPGGSVTRLSYQLTFFTHSRVKRIG